MAEGILFQGISQEEYDQMMVCFQAVEKVYQPEELICTYDEGKQRIGIILEGEAALIRIQEDGHQTLLEYLHEKDIFGEALSVFSNQLDLVEVIATKRCVVQFIDYDHLIKRCSKACSFHSVLVSNVIQLISQKAIQLNERLEVLSQRTIRQKLLCCLRLMSAQQGSNTVLLPFSLGSLADYLCIDRSAMMRELGKLKAEKILQVNKRQITLLILKR